MGMRTSSTNAVVLQLLAWSCRRKSHNTNTTGCSDNPHCMSEISITMTTWNWTASREYVIFLGPKSKLTDSPWYRGGCTTPSGYGRDPCEDQQLAHLWRGPLPSPSWDRRLYYSSSSGSPPWSCRIPRDVWMSERRLGETSSSTVNQVMYKPVTTAIAVGMFVQPYQISMNQLELGSSWHFN